MTHRAKLGTLLEEHDAGYTISVRKKTKGAEARIASLCEALEAAPYGERITEIHVFSQEVHLNLLALGIGPYNLWRSLLYRPSAACC